MSRRASCLLMMAGLLTRLPWRQTVSRWVDGLLAVAEAEDLQ